MKKIRCLGGKGFRANKRLHLSVRVLIFFLTLLPSAFVTAADKPQPPDAYMDSAIRSFWDGSSNAVERCITLQVAASQLGIQQVVQNFVPGQWAIRIDANRTADIDRMEFLTKMGFVERKNIFLNVGPISTVPAVEYSPTLRGWANNLSKEETVRWPCFFIGVVRVLRVNDFTESEKDADGYTTVKINFVIGVSEPEGWARVPEAISLFPEIGNALKGEPGSFELYRAPNGRLKNYKANPKYIEEANDQAPVPSITTVREAVERTRQFPDAKRAMQLPPACFPLIPANLIQLWNAGPSSAGADKVLRYSDLTEGSSKREVEERTYVRLAQLERAGLVTLKHDPIRKELVIRTSKVISQLIEREGNCLPLGTVRVDVIAGTSYRSEGGSGHGFKARYLVEKPSPWIQSIKSEHLPPDLKAALQHGQPFEGFVAKPPEGWIAGYTKDRRPQPAPASLISIGSATFWHRITDQSIAQTSVANHDAYAVYTYEGVKAQRGAVDAYGRLKVPEPPMTTGREGTFRNVQVLPSAKPLIVVLSGYEPINWRFNLHPQARVSAVLAIGYHEQSVIGLPAATALLTASNLDGKGALNPMRTHSGINFEGLRDTLRKSGVLKTHRVVEDGSIVLEDVAVNRNDPMRR